MKKLRIVIIFLICLGYKALQAQFIERLDEDRGFEAFRLGADLSTGFYLDKYINHGLYLEPIVEKPLTFMHCEVWGMRLYHSNYQVQEIVLFIKPQYDKILKNQLLSAYGKPVEFEEKKGLVKAMWKGKVVHLQVEFHYAGKDPEDSKYKDAIAVTISYAESAKITASF
ncbi:MAG: hypothetical protein RML72_11595 [Bacteroidia bacterium]|nr:hypothetical protein [Bacteroidia bacterium]MDW8159500.1 hypothetical protein [Bacteroidia bacterium]